MNTGGRRVIIRFAPEMNGNWNYWGLQPTNFISLWRRVHAALKRDAPLTGLMWAPSSGNGYPYGTSTPTAADMLLLDTNKDGLFNALDDPYLPFWPGDEYVDWVGVSVYHYGTQFPWEDNVIPTPGKFEEILNTGNFYQEYAVKHNKPVAIAETSSTFHLSLATPPNVRLPIGPGELAIKQAWWNQFITSREFIAKYPKVKMICLFEFLKAEESTIRDFRFTNNTEILNAFKTDIAPFMDTFILANSTATVTKPDITDSLRPSPTKTSGALGWDLLWGSIVVAGFDL